MHVGAASLPLHTYRFSQVASLVSGGFSVLSMAELSTLALYSVVILAVVYYLYRAALPKPIPGIPYNEASAKRILGDAPEAIEAQTTTGNTFSYILGQQLKHNVPVIQLFLRPFGKPFVILSDFRETQDICVRRSRYPILRLHAFHFDSVLTFDLQGVRPLELLWRHLRIYLA